MTTDGYAPHGHNCWQDFHEDHNRNQVERYRKLCDDLDLEWKEELTLKDVCNYLEEYKRLGKFVEALTEVVTKYGDSDD